MSGIPSQHNAFTVAKESLTMAEKSGDRSLKFFGMAMFIAGGVSFALVLFARRWSAGDKLVQP